MKKTMNVMMTALGGMAAMFATIACIGWFGKPEMPEELLRK